ncbi:MAG: hypothetical protein V2B19_15740 [Pseudomonadota bacterium]
MRQRSRNRRADSADNVIPFPVSWSADMEAFRVQTDELVFLIVLHSEKDRQPQGNGYFVSESGSKYCFTIEANCDPDIREKCLAAVRRIASFHGGEVQRGRIDRYGVFYGDNDPDAEEE